MDINNFNVDQARSLVKNYINNTPESVLYEILTKIEKKASSGIEYLILSTNGCILKELNYTQIKNIENLLKFRGFIVTWNSIYHLNISWSLEKNA
jgi:hypothetical protein